MKPKERLLELFKEDQKLNPQNDSIVSNINAIVNYLEEEHEKKTNLTKDN